MRKGRVQKTPKKIWVILEFLRVYFFSPRSKPTGLPGINRKKATRREMCPFPEEFRLFDIFWRPSNNKNTWANVWKRRKKILFKDPGQEPCTALASGCRQNQKAYKNKNKKQLVNTKATPSLTNPAGGAHDSYCKFFFHLMFVFSSKKVDFYQRWRARHGFAPVLQKIVSRSVKSLWTIGTTEKEPCLVWFGLVWDGGTIPTYLLWSRSFS